MIGDDDEAFGPVVVPEPEPLTMQPHDDPARIQEIQQRLRGETTAYHRGLAKRQFKRKA